MTDNTEDAPSTEARRKFAHVLKVDLEGDAIEPKGRVQRAALRWLERRGADPRPPDNDGKGRWPTTRQQFLWDLVPNEIAANRDGIIPPDWDLPEWAENAPESEVEHLLVVASAARREGEETVRNVELKASRLANILVAMLAATIALIAFEISKIGPNPSWWRIAIAVIGIITGAMAAWFLVIGMSRAVDADTRMGITQRASPRRQAGSRRTAFYAELYGHHLAEETRKGKVTRLLNARAAVSRSLVFLTLSAVFGFALAIVASVTEDKTTVIQSPTPAPATSRQSGPTSPSRTMAPSMKPSASPPPIKPSAS
jgi:hypothetical protein